VNIVVIATVTGKLQNYVLFGMALLINVLNIINGHTLFTDSVIAGTSWSIDVI